MQNLTEYAIISTRENPHGMFYINEEINQMPIEKLQHSTDRDDELDELVARAQNGDGDAFGEIVSRFERFVYNTALSVLRNAGASPDLADDIAQNAFIKAWRSLSSFRGEASLSTWLFRITVNTARDTLRAQSRRGELSLTRDDSDSDEICEWDLPVMSGDTIPEDMLEKSELIRGVRRAIEKLPEEQRQVVVLRDIHELSYIEISRILGVGLGTVKSRLNRGRANLKTILENGNFI